MIFPRAQAARGGAGDRTVALVVQSALAATMRKVRDFGCAEPVARGSVDAARQHRAIPAVSRKQIPSWHERKGLIGLFLSLIRRPVVAGRSAIRSSAACSRFPDPWGCRSPAMREMRLCRLQQPRLVETITSGEVVRMRSSRGAPPLAIPPRMLPNAVCIETASNRPPCASIKSWGRSIRDAL